MIEQLRLQTYKFSYFSHPSQASLRHLTDVRYEIHVPSTFSHLLITQIIRV